MWRIQFDGNVRSSVLAPVTHSVSTMYRRFSKVDKIVLNCRAKMYKFILSDSHLHSLVNSFMFSTWGWRIDGSPIWIFTILLLVHTLTIDGTYKPRKLSAQVRPKLNYQTCLVPSNISRCMWYTCKIWLLRGLKFSQFVWSSESLVIIVGPI